MDNQTSTIDEAFIAATLDRSQPKMLSELSLPPEAIKNASFGTKMDQNLQFRFTDWFFLLKKQLVISKAEDSNRTTGQSCRVSEENSCSGALQEKFGYTDVYPPATLERMAKKDFGMRIRLQRELRDDFVATCRAQDRPAAQVIREFMRDYVARNAAAIQPSLFDQESIS